MEVDAQGPAPAFQARRRRWILRRSRRLKPKAAPAPSRGTGPGTLVWEKSLARLSVPTSGDGTQVSLTQICLPEIAPVELSTDDDQIGDPVNGVKNTSFTLPLGAVY